MEIAHFKSGFLYSDARKKMSNWFSPADKSNKLSPSSTKNWIMVCDYSKMSFSLSESYFDKNYFGIKKMITDVVKFHNF